MKYIGRRNKGLRYLYIHQESAVHVSDMIYQLAKVIDMRTPSIGESQFSEEEEKKLVVDILRHFGEVLLETSVGKDLINEWRVDIKGLFTPDDPAHDILLKGIGDMRGSVLPCVRLFEPLVEYLFEAMEYVGGDMKFRLILDVLEHDPVLYKRPEHGLVMPENEGVLKVHQRLLCRFRELFAGIYSNAFAAGIGNIQLYRMSIEKLLKNAYEGAGASKLTAEQEDILRSQYTQCVRYQEVLAELIDKKKAIEKRLNPVTRSFRLKSS